MSKPSKLFLALYELAIFAFSLGYLGCGKSHSIQVYWFNFVAAGTCFFFSNLSLHKNCQQEIPLIK